MSGPERRDAAWRKEGSTATLRLARRPLHHCERTLTQPVHPLGTGLRLAPLSSVRAYAFRINGEMGKEIPALSLTWAAADAGSASALILPN